jgi:uncharacterized membrane protein YeiB
VDLSPPTHFVDTAPSTRLRGPDVVRAVALIGVIVMNYHGYLILRSFDSGTATPRTGWLEELFDPWDGPLSTRFAATFVLVAGVSVTLLTRRTIGDPTQVTDMRWRLVRRGVLLYVVGLVLDEIWPGTIIVYYGVMFVLAAAIFTWRSRWIIAIGAGAAIAATSIRLWEFDRNQNGHDTSWLTSPDQGSPRRYALDVFVNGTHPLLPWFAFLCAGIVLGRTLDTSWWRPAATAIGFTLLTASTLLSTIPATGLAHIALSLDPYSRSLVYGASAMGTALLAYVAIDWLAERFPVATDPLRRAGQLTLSLYLAHIVVFKLLVDWLGWIEPAGADLALLFAAGFWVTAVVVGMSWQRRFGRGPAEYAYRAFGG